eukprot:10941638-Alexandrium_andersonii.AAC.1
MNRISSERAAATSSESRAAPVMSSRYGCPLDPDRRPSERSDIAHAGGPSAARKSTMPSTSASPTP